VSGNVSLYNDTDGKSIKPTPTIGMVGLLEDVENRVAMSFRRAGDLVARLGETRDELGGSEFLRTIRGRDEGPCPEIDLEAEGRLIGLLLSLAERRLLSSAHDIADGGLAVALAECAMASGLGAEITLHESSYRPSALLFGESTGRVLVSFDPAAREEVILEAEHAGVPLLIGGRVGGDRLRLQTASAILLDERVEALREIWRHGFVRAIEAADVL